jgi:heme/copper-type cytochrome/quinol oxidase subunit 3
MSKSKLAVILVIGTEAVFFTLLILAFLYFRSIAKGNSNPEALLDIVKTGIFSLFLFSSSFTVWRAEKNAEHQRVKRSAFWLFITMLFGVIFLTGQGIEWNFLIQHGQTISRDLFGTTFFTLTGFHGFHVLAGLLILGILLILSLTGNFKHQTTIDSVGAVALYWHFVDIVWVFIFSIVYLGVKL